MLGTRRPAAGFAEETIGESKVTNEFLVTYASPAGSTAGAANAIGRVLAETEAQVDVRRMQDVKDLGPYTAVVAGSAVRGARWLPEANGVRAAPQVRAGPRALRCLPGLHHAGDAGGAEYGQFVSDFIKPVRSLVKPVSEGTFAGALDYGKVPFIPDGVQLRILSAASQTPPADYRNWDAIRNWARNLAIS